MKSSDMEKMRAIGLKGITLWFDDDHRINFGENKPKPKRQAPFGATLKEDIYASGLVTQDRNGARLASVLSRHLTNAGVRSYEDVAQGKFDKLSGKAGFGQVQADLLQRMQGRLRQNLNQGVTPREALSHPASL